MLITWLNMLVLCAATCCGAARLPDDGSVAAPTAVVQYATDDEQDAVEIETAPTICLTLASGGPRVVTVSTTDDQALPKVWMGVRLTAVPEPLAAHIGDSGVMIANVAKDSPADRAGIAQYDVVVGFNGKDITRPQDLTAAIAEISVGQPAKLGIIRKGKPQELALTLAERAAGVEVEWKYAEPQEAGVDAAIKMYGRALQRDANGNWKLEDLGQLYTLPDTLKKLEDLDIGLDVDKLNEELGRLTDPNGPLHKMDVRILHGLKSDGTSCIDIDKDARIELKMKVADDGKQTTIETGADGKFTVTHVDADGNQSSATYENAEEFEKGDPEAFKIYSEHCAHPGLGRTFEHCIIHPFGARTLRLQHDFQVDVEKRVQEALEAAKKAQVRVGQAREEALKEYKEKLGQAQIEVHRGHGAGEPAETLMVRVNDDGTIKVTTTENGEQVTREFKTREEFKATEPDLYARVQSLLE